MLMLKLTAPSSLLKCEVGIYSYSHRFCFTATCMSLWVVGQLHLWPVAFMGYKFPFLS